jgi:glycosyltransferase involved in cell wall biosynthesis
MTAIVHVTHEAVHKVGGIGTVLHGLITANAYAAYADRTILLGPLQDNAGSKPLGPEGEVIYDSGLGIWSNEVGPALQGVEVAQGVRLVYGRRPLRNGDRTVYPEVLLVDVSQPPNGLGFFKYHLYQAFEVHSDWYEGIEEYERYLRLAEPGFSALQALLGSADAACFLIAHDFMGMATVLKAIMDGDKRIATVFYAHEVASARLLVEEGDGRDIRFYNALRAVRAKGKYIADIFGPQETYYKHALVSQAWRCDAVLAVGDWVIEELRFLGPEFDGRSLDLVYNGIQAEEIDLKEKIIARDKVLQYGEALLGYRPELVFTHVGRLVISKGLWRDLLVLKELDGVLASQGRTAIFLVLATETGPRDAGLIRRMSKAYGWPLVHREGHGDLAPKELEFDLQVRAFNARSRAVKVVFVNQFGWDAFSCGPGMPADMSFADLRRGSDVEFGLSIYEPFGIAQVEPLAFGAISAVSDVCGCIGFVDRVSQGRRPSGFLTADYTRLAAAQAARWWDISDEMAVRNEVKHSRALATRLAQALPTSKKAAAALLAEGQQTALAMSWEEVVKTDLLPALRRVEPRPF